MIDVLFTPAEFARLSDRDLGRTTCVVFDILRGTTSIITALGHGAAAVIPVIEIAEALAVRAQRPEVLLAGERHGLRIRADQAGGVEFDLANSPREYTAQKVRGRTIVTTTTNGTRALRACAGAHCTLVGSFLNLSALAGWIEQHPAEDLLLVCSGTGEQAAYEDVLAAGALLEKLGTRAKNSRQRLGARQPSAALDGRPGLDSSPASDAALMALCLWQQAADRLLDALRSSSNGQRLLAQPELAPDVPFSLRHDTIPLVAAMRQGMIRTLLAPLVVLLFLLAAAPCCHRMAAVTVRMDLERAPAETVPWGLTNWMGALDGQLKLSQLSIPGAHNAGAHQEPVPGTARCQSLSIREQLEAGVRFLDVRCRHVANGFTIHHGAVDQRLKFDEVLEACWSFLRTHPSESIVMSVKEEYDPANNTRSFEATFDACVQKNAAGWWLGAAVPTLNQARGKMVLLRRFRAAGSPKGLDASRWPDNTTFAVTNGETRLKVQDGYKVTDQNLKWTRVADLLSEAGQGGPDLLHLNFTSGYQPLLFGIPSITAVSEAIHPRLADYLAAHPRGRCGIIVMDFVSAKLNTLIIRTNF
jgi:1-phosphatidylinositol phosphodiesterase